MPRASIALAMVLAVYMPPQAPAPGHACLMVSNRFASSIRLAANDPAKPKTTVSDLLLPRVLIAQAKVLAVYMPPQITAIQVQARALQAGKGPPAGSPGPCREARALQGMERFAGSQGPCREGRAFFQAAKGPPVGSEVVKAVMCIHL